VDCNEVELELWDTDGDPRQIRRLPSITNNANAYVIVFDVTDRNSFDNIEIWRTFVVNDPRTSLFAFANKSEAKEEEKQVNIAEARESLRRLGITLVEVSAKTGQNIEDGFRLIANQVLENQRKMRLQGMHRSAHRPECKCCCF
jgi:GTPase SAR1 family protein